MKAYPLRKAFFLCLISLCLFACRPGFDLAHLQAPPPQPEQLPRLQLELDPVTFGHLYPAPFLEESHMDETGRVNYVVQPRPQVHYQDVNTIAARTLANSFCVPRGEYYGTARLNVTSYSVMGRAPGLILLSVSSLFILNLAGMPIRRVEAVMEFEMDILDARGQLLKSYIGQGRADQWIGMYYGGGDAERTVHAKAVNRAFQDIQAQVTKDVKLLKEIMAQIGPLRVEGD